MDRKLKLIVIAVFSLSLLLIVGALSFNQDDNEENNTSNRAGSKKAELIKDDGDAQALAKKHASKPVYKVYFENSGSMDGYVEGHTRLKDALFDLFTNLQQIADTIELNFLNTIVIPRNEGIRDFLYNLHRDRFRVAGGNRGQTDMTRIFELVLEEKSHEDVIIMISDCILSPGTGDDAANFLNKHRIELRRIFSEHLKNNDFNTLVLRLNTDFRGIYYNQFEGRTTIPNKERPYFIWIFGHETYLTQMQRLIAGTSLIQRDLTNSHYLCLWSQAQLNYQILPNPRIGSFTLNPSNPRSMIENARVSNIGHHTGIFEFSLGIDFTGFPLGEDYYTNPENYELSMGYSLSIVSSPNQRFTHLLKVRTENLRSGVMEINLKNIIPQWVEDLNLYDDINILSEEQISKTFGIKYLFMGAHEGYLTHPEYNQNFFTIRISINT